MQEPDEQAGDVSIKRDTQVDLHSINILVGKLASKDGPEREGARWALVSIGSPAVARLVESLKSPKKQVRWEAAKALADIRDPMAASALVKALEDKIFDVRWVAAEGLINLGHEGLIPLLEALIEHADSPWLLRGAHHVLHDIDKGDLGKILEPVISALEDLDSTIEAPLKAKAALDALRGAEPNTEKI